MLARLAHDQKTKKSFHCEVDCDQLNSVPLTIEGGGGVHDGRTEWPLYELQRQVEAPRSRCQVAVVTSRASIPNRGHCAHDVHSEKMHYHMATVDAMRRSGKVGTAGVATLGTGSSRLVPISLS